MLSPYTNEKVDLLNIVKAKYPRELDSNEETRGLAKYLHRFLSTELMPFEESQVDAQIRNFEPFLDAKTEHARLHRDEFLR